MSTSGPRRDEASFLVEPLAVPTRVPQILLEPLRVAVPAPRPLVLPVPAANELVQLWYAAGIQAIYGSQEKQSRRCMPGAGGASAERDPQTDAVGHVAARRRLREHRGSLAAAPGSPLKSTSDERQLGRHKIQGLPLAACSSPCPMRYYWLWSTNAARGILKAAPCTELWPEHMPPSLPESRDPKKSRELLVSRIAN